MEIFVTGATGYIGGAIAHRLMRDGHRVSGLVRDAVKAQALRAQGIAPVLGSLDDAAVLADAARRADAVVNAADSDHRGAIETLLAALAGSGKALLHTSGSSICADGAAGELSPRVSDDDHPLPAPVAAKAARVALDRRVLDAAASGVRAVVICNTLIYGRGPGLHPRSAQLPGIADRARRDGVVRHVGRGLNVWSNVHIDDVAELYARALDRAPAGLFCFAENGEASFQAMTAAIAARLGLGAPQPWPADAAVAELGYSTAMFSLASNSRVRGLAARRALGWTPLHADVLAWIATGEL